MWCRCCVLQVPALDLSGINTTQQPQQQQPAQPGPERYTVAPENPKETVKLSLRGLDKEVKIPCSYKLNKVVSRILPSAPVECELEQVTVVVLRPNPEPGASAGEFGVFTGSTLTWHIWEAGLMANDIVHVIAPLPPNWHLCEAADSKVLWPRAAFVLADWYAPIGVLL